MRVPGGEHIFGLIPAEQLYKEVAVPPGAKQQPASPSSQVPWGGAGGQQGPMCLQHASGSPGREVPL